MSTVVYLGSYSGKSKTTGKPYNMVTLGELSDDGESRVKQYFTQDEICEDLIFGDVVKASFIEGKFLGDTPRLNSLVFVSISCFISWLLYTTEFISIPIEASSVTDFII